MKTPKTKAATAALPGVHPQVEPGIFPLLWRDDFAVGHGTCRKFIRGLRVMHYPNSKVEFNGQRYQWAL